MIKELFIPQEIQGYFLIKTKIAALFMEESGIDCIVLSAQGKQRTIVGHYHESFAQGNKEEALKTLLQKIGPVDELVCNIANNLVITKELTLPFADRDKIKQVLPYELASSTPFSDIAVDFLLFKKEKKKEAAIVAAIAQQSAIEAIRALFAQNGAWLTKIAPSSFALYSLIEELSLIDRDTYFFVDVQVGYITLSYIEQHQLKMVRTIPYGAGPDQLRIAAQEIQMTISNATKQAEESPIYMYQQHELAQLIQATTIETTPGWKEYNLATLALAYPTEHMHSFNLMREETSPRDKRAIAQGTVVALILIALLAALVGWHYYTTIGSINKEIKKNELLMRKAIQNNFVIDQKKAKGSLKSLLKEVSSRVSRDEATWLAFSRKTKFSYLRYLYELSNLINMQETELSLERLTFTDKSIIMKASVPSFDALDRLMKELQESSLFYKIVPPQETTFSIELFFKEGI